jgi:hypothetical protein
LQLRRLRNVRELDELVEIIIIMVQGDYSDDDGWKILLLLAFACHVRNRQLFLLTWLPFQISPREFKISPTSAHACLILHVEDSGTFLRKPMHDTRHVRNWGTCTYGTYTCIPGIRSVEYSYITVRTGTVPGTRTVSTPCVANRAVLINFDICFFSSTSLLWIALQE